MKSKKVKMCLLSPTKNFGPFKHSRLHSYLYFRDEICILFTVFLMYVSKASKYVLDFYCVSKRINGPNNLRIMLDYPVRNSDVAGDCGAPPLC